MSAFSRQIGRNSLWVTSHDKIMVAHRLMVGGKLQSSHEPAILKPSPTWMPARRADNTGRPSQPFQVVKTISIRQEPNLKFPKRLWVVNTGARTSHPLSLRPTPVNWIPQMVILPYANKRQRTAGCIPRSLYPMTVGLRFCSSTASSPCPSSVFPPDRPPQKHHPVTPSHPAGRC